MLKGKKFCFAIITLMGSILASIFAMNLLVGCNGKDENEIDKSGYNTYQRGQELYC